MTTGLVGMITGTAGSMTAKLAFGAPAPELVFCVGVWVGVVSVRR